MSIKTTILSTTSKEIYAFNKEERKLIQYTIKHYKHHAFRCEDDTLVYDSIIVAIDTNGNECELKLFGHENPFYESPECFDNGVYIETDTTYLRIEDLLFREGLFFRSNGKTLCTYTDTKNYVIEDYVVSHGGGIFEIDFPELSEIRGKMTYLSSEDRDRLAPYEIVNKDGTTTHQGELADIEITAEQRACLNDLGKALKACHDAGLYLCNDRCHDYILALPQNKFSYELNADNGIPSAYVSLLNGVQGYGIDYIYEDGDPVTYVKK